MSITWICIDEIRCLSITPVDNYSDHRTFKSNPKYGFKTVADNKMRTRQRFVLQGVRSENRTETSMNNKGTWIPGAPYPSRSPVISSCPIIIYNEHDASNNASSIAVKNIYTYGNKIFIGHDTCANVHSVPYSCTCPGCTILNESTGRSIGTSGVLHPHVR